MASAKYKQSDVVSIVTLTGEFVGRFVSESTTEVIIKNPRLLTQAQNGAGFLPAVCMTGVVEPDEVGFNKSVVAFVVKTAEEVEKEYIAATSGLVL